MKSKLSVLLFLIFVILFGCSKQQKSVTVSKELLKDEFVLLELLELKENIILPALDTVIKYNSECSYYLYKSKNFFRVRLYRKLNENENDRMKVLSQTFYRYVVLPGFLAPYGVFYYKSYMFVVDYTSLECAEILPEYFIKTNRFERIRTSYYRDGAYFYSEDSKVFENVSCVFEKVGNVFVLINFIPCKGVE